MSGNTIPCVHSRRVVRTVSPQSIAPTGASPIHFTPYDVADCEDCGRQDVGLSFTIGPNSSGFFFRHEAVERHAAQTAPAGVDLVIRILSHGDHNCADHQCFSVNEIAGAVNYAAGAVSPAEQRMTRSSFTTICLKTLVRELESALEHERRPFQPGGGQHHNGPRRVSIELDVHRAAKVLEWAKSALAGDDAAGSPSETGDIKQ